MDTCQHIFWCYHQQMLLSYLHQMSHSDKLLSMFLFNYQHINYDLFGIYKHSSLLLDQQIGALDMFDCTHGLYLNGTNLTDNLLHIILDDFQHRDLALRDKIRRICVWKDQRISFFLHYNQKHKD